MAKRLLESAFAPFREALYADQREKQEAWHYRKASMVDGLSVRLPPTPDYSRNPDNPPRTG
jgi:hypothetical protein